jgi:starch synthase
MKILFVTSEAIPYFKTGGLGDVSRALPDALAAAGHDVRILLPLYGGVRERLDRFEVEAETLLPWPGTPVPVRFLVHRPPNGASAVFIEQPEFFEPGTPYGGGSGDPLETGRRFALFGRAAARYAGLWGADIAQLNDWTTGLFPIYAMLDRIDVPTVFAIHNLGYQGNYWPDLLRQVGIPHSLLRTENGLEFHRTASFMKAGLALADRLVTVSPTYALEIQTPEFGHGFDGLLRFRRRVLHGVLNGLNTALWNPAHDRHLRHRYTAATLDGKDSNRAPLLAECGLGGDTPVFAMVTRLVHQKGIDLVLRAMPALLEAGFRLIVLGDGDRGFEWEVQQLARAHPDRIAAFFRFDEPLAHRIYAGADFFLMPSRYEPCGLGQMIAQRYGTPPVARRTGGLADTVNDRKTGFLFDDASPEALVDAARRAAAVWRVKGWNAIRRRCMRVDHSWQSSAEEYERIYRFAIGNTG